MEKDPLQVWPPHISQNVYMRLIVTDIAKDIIQLGCRYSYFPRNPSSKYQSRSSLNLLSFGLF